MKRHVDERLTAWKNKPYRKSLLLRGARQVGKTYSVRELAKQFPSYIEVNFELMPKVRTFFEEDREPQELVRKLSSYFNMSVTPGETLLFLDEIQACPDALHSLRYFYEEMPGLHVIAAGSLLEFALEELSSFGVGRIEFLYMYPLSFFEFLEATKAGRLVSLIKEMTPDKPLDGPFHDKLMELMRYFIMTGGMPEVVATFAGTNDVAAAVRVQNALLLSLTNDFAKYRKRAPTRRLTEVFRSIAMQSGSKFKYSAVSDESSTLIKDSLELLIKAGIAYPVIHSDARGVPLGAQIRPRRFKVIVFDTGLTMRLLGMKTAEVVTTPFEELVNRGSLAEQFVGLELMKASPPEGPSDLYYWHREAAASNAELDYVTTYERQIVPIEVKSGSRGKMQSLYRFLDERGLQRGFRVAGEPAGQYDRIIVLPLYAVANLQDEKWMRDNFPSRA
ncbi:MAG TPA: AAA family ATPase [bacterium]|nr:AAA family ATPase [bacterium]